MGPALDHAPAPCQSNSFPWCRQHQAVPAVPSRLPPGWLLRACCGAGRRGVRGNGCTGPPLESTSSVAIRREISNWHVLSKWTLSKLTSLPAHLFCTQNVSLQWFKVLQIVLAELTTTTVELNLSSTRAMQLLLYCTEQCNMQLKASTHHNNVAVATVEIRTLKICSFPSLVTTIEQCSSNCRGHDTWLCSSASLVTTCENCSGKNTSICSFPSILTASYHRSCICRTQNTWLCSFP